LGKSGHWVNLAAGQIGHRAIWSIDDTARSCDLVISARSRAVTSSRDALLLSDQIPQIDRIDE